MDEKPIILDACVTLTLYASGKFSAILAGLPYDFRIGERAHAESQWVRAVGADERVKVDLSGAVFTRILTIEHLDGLAEQELFANLAAEVDDGEAEAAALAIVRGYTLSTDDRKVIRVCRQRYPALEVLTTPQILRAWQLHSGISDDTMRETLFRVSSCATYSPGRSDDGYDWWRSLSQG